MCCYNYMGTYNYNQRLQISCAGYQAGEANSWSVFFHSPGALQIWNVGRTIINHRFWNGWNLIHKIDYLGDGFWHCFTHIIYVIIYNLYNPLMFNRNPSVGIYNDYGWPPAGYDRCSPRSVWADRSQDRRISCRRSVQHRPLIWGFPIAKFDSR